VEVLVNDKPAPPGQAGQIAITDLLNYGMPFVRNKIGDWGRVATEPCECGSHLPLLSGLEGRDTDMIYRPDGSQILGGMIIDICWDLKEVTALQIVQKQLDSVELVLEVNEHYRPEVGEKAVSELRLFLGENARIELRTVDEIPRNPTSGKYQEVISKVRLPG
jgi:phenylacetate-CoA ligase